MSVSAAVLVSTLLLAAPPAGAVATKAPSVAPGTVQVKHCLISMIDHVRLSAREAGPVLSLPIKEGAVLKNGDLIAQLDDSDSQIKKVATQFEADVAAEQANSDVNVRAGKKMADVAKAEWEQAVEINRINPGAVAETEVRRLKLTWERALLQIEVAELELNVAKLTAKAKQAAVDAADIEISRRKVVAPIDCMVDRLLVKQSEWVQPGQPVAELVRIDRLRVEAFLNAYEVSPREIVGRQVTIEVPTRGTDGKEHIEEFTGKIDFISPVVVADGAYRVTVEFDNRQEGEHWAVQPGMTANMTIKLSAPAATPVITSQPPAKPVSNQFVPPAEQN